MTVSLGEKMPTWGLRRWRGKGLRFMPLDDEGFTLCGDKQTLEYKGRRRSHRFTILGDNAFEYDVILNKEPISNVIKLYMEEAENYNFYRQPDFVPDPFLKGSFAVYKKEILIGQGTGKLCHIHRPLIIDARGQRVWGELSIVGNELHITVPEQWLSEAVYPVIVDPVIGTTIVGSQFLPYTYFSDTRVLTRYPVLDSIKGLCTAYIYCENMNSNGGAFPYIYTDNNNLPNLLKSSSFDSISLGVHMNNPIIGWRSCTFSVDEVIPKGNNIWFGFSVKTFSERFDYGDYLTVRLIRLNMTTVYSALVPGDILDSFDRIYSWYFTYEPGPQQENYSVVLTQGVSLNDKRITKVDYIRKLKGTIIGSDKLSIAYLFYTLIKDNIKVIDTYRHILAYSRKIIEIAKNTTNIIQNRLKTLILKDTVNMSGYVFSGLFIKIKIFTGLIIRDRILRHFLIAREEIALKSCITREINLESSIK